MHRYEIPLASCAQQPTGRCREVARSSVSGREQACEPDLRLGVAMFSRARDPRKTLGYIVECDANPELRLRITPAGRIDLSLSWRCCTGRKATGDRL